MQSSALMSNFDEKGIQGIFFHYKNSLYFTNRISYNLNAAFSRKVREKVIFSVPFTDSVKFLLRQGIIDEQTFLL